jgi:hypothetical protein
MNACDSDMDARNETATRPSMPRIGVCDEDSGAMNTQEIRAADNKEVNVYGSDSAGCRDRDRAE